MSWLDVRDGERADCNFLGSVSEIKSAQENRHCLDTSLLSSQCIINMSCVILSHGAAHNALSLLPASAEQRNPFSLIHSQPCRCPNVKHVNAKLRSIPDLQQHGYTRKLLRARVLSCLRFPGPVCPHYKTLL